jgi:hypothetical protein
VCGAVFPTPLEGGGLGQQFVKYSYPYIFNIVYWFLIGCITNRNYRSNSLCKEILCLRKASTLCVEWYWMQLSKADDFWSCALDRLDKPFLELLPALMGPSSFLPLFPALLDLPGKLLLYA